MVIKSGTEQALIRPKTYRNQRPACSQDMQRFGNSFREIAPNQPDQERLVRATPLQASYAGR